MLLESFTFGGFPVFLNNALQIMPSEGIENQEHIIGSFLALSVPGQIEEAGLCDGHRRVRGIILAHAYLKFFIIKSLKTITEK